MFGSMIGNVMSPPTTAQPSQPPTLGGGLLGLLGQDNPLVQGLTRPQPPATVGGGAAGQIHPLAQALGMQLQRPTNPGSFGGFPGGFGGFPGGFGGFPGGFGGFGRGFAPDMFGLGGLGRFGGFLR